MLRRLAPALCAGAALVLISCSAVLIACSSLSAQAPVSPFVPDTAPVLGGAPHWAGEFAILSGNAVLSGVTAGVVRKLHGGSFREGFLRGLVGGGVVYLGKRLVAERFSGSGLLGREVAAVGGSMVSNAGDGVGVLDRLILPAGIARVYVDRRPPPGAPRLRVRLDALAAGWTLYAIRQGELSFDGGASLSAGTPVFRTHNKVMNQGDVRAGGYSQAGVLLLSDVPAWGPLFATRQLHHELVHMVQEDQIQATWLRPLQRAALSRFRAGRVLDDWVDVNISTQVLDLLSDVVKQHDVRPWELEADYLAKRR